MPKTKKVTRKAVEPKLSKKVQEKVRRESDKTVWIMMLVALVLAVAFLVFMAFFGPKMKLRSALSKTINTMNFSLRVGDDDRLTYVVDKPLIATVDNIKDDDGNIIHSVTYEDYGERRILIGVDDGVVSFKRDLYDTENDFDGNFSADSLVTVGVGWADNGVLENALKHANEFKYSNGVYSIETLPLTISEYTENALNEARKEAGLEEIKKEEMIIHDLKFTIKDGYIKDVSYDDYLFMDGEKSSSTYELFNVNKTKIDFPEYE